jgi:hypothetical protein
MDDSVPADWRDKMNTNKWLELASVLNFAVGVFYYFTGNIQMATYFVLTAIYLNMPPRKSNP